MVKPKGDPKFDQIGYWSELKLEIIQKYATAYSKILAAQPRLHHCYIDGFAGGGIALSRTTNEMVPGSPLNALLVVPPFQELFLVDMDGEKFQLLQSLVGHDPRVRLFEGDCNEILPKHVFPKVRFQDYRRALCLLDPYGLQLDWGVIAEAGNLKTIDMFLNFPIMDINRNAIWHNPESAGELGISRMNRFWGDESWRQVAYLETPGLFGPMTEKTSNEDVVEAFRERLKKVAGFGNVPSPLPMRNSKGAVVYYLFFASQKPVAENIVSDIFSRYRERS